MILQNSALDGILIDKWILTYTSGHCVQEICGNHLKTSDYNGKYRLHLITIIKMRKTTKYPMIYLLACWSFEFIFAMLNCL